MVKKTTGKTALSEDAPAEEEEKKEDPDQPPVDDLPME